MLLHEEMFFTAILLTMRHQPANMKTNKLGLQGLHNKEDFVTKMELTNISNRFLQQFLGVTRDF